MTGDLTIERPLVNTSFENFVFIYIDNRQSQLNKYEKQLNQYWDGCFIGKKYFLKDSEIDQVRTVIDANLKRNCIIFCDKNMRCVKGESFLVDLRKEYKDDTIILILFTAHPDPDIKLLFEYKNIGYSNKQDFNLTLRRIKDSLTPNEDEFLGLSELFTEENSLSYKDSNLQNLALMPEPKKIIEPINTTRDENFKLIFEATVYNVNKQSNMIEMRIKNPENPDDTVIQSFSSNLFRYDINKLVTNQIFNISQTIIDDGSINIKFQDTGKIESSPRSISLWDKNLQDSFDDIQPL
ncbi:MAG: hypothetical protein AAF489_01010 [Bacteroidota bacterium]